MCGPDPRANFVIRRGGIPEGVVNVQYLRSGTAVPVTNENAVMMERLDKVWKAFHKHLHFVGIAYGKD
jgi:hypothetical protein